MGNKLIRFFTGEGPQRRKEAIEETKKIANRLRLSNNARSIDKTIGYLIKNETNIIYRGIE